MKILAIILLFCLPFFGADKPQSLQMYEAGIEQFNAKNYALAKEYLSSACYDKNAPVSEACTDLGVMYYEGHGVAYDMQRASELFKLACYAKEPSFSACGLLSGMYFLKELPSEDRFYSINLAKRACENEARFACFFLGVDYLDIGDLNSAKKYLKIACDDKNSDACEILNQIDDGLAR